MIIFNYVDNLSNYIAEPSENLPDSVMIPEGGLCDWGGEPITAIDSAEEKVREARLWRRDL